MVGKRFGKLVVLAMVARRYVSSCGSPIILYKCQCDCGRVVNVRGGSLRSGNTTSCGCGRAHYLSSQRVFRMYQQAARRRKISFRLSLQYVIKITSQNCFYCNTPPLKICLHAKKYGQPYKYNGIDRKNNSKGYTVRNCVPCCTICNIAKAQLSIKQFKCWIRAVYKNIYR